MVVVAIKLGSNVDLTGWNKSKHNTVKINNSQQNDKIYMEK